MAMVVPWLTELMSAGAAPVRSRILRRPVRKPSAGSDGVDGVLVTVSSPVSSSNATTSVNVPPVSIPIRSRLSVSSG